MEAQRLAFFLERKMSKIGVLQAELSSFTLFQVHFLTQYFLLYDPQQSIRVWLGLNWLPSLVFLF
jgi:hypothetical protein